MTSVALSLRATLIAEALARELVDHAQHAEGSSVMGAIRDEVIGPHVIRTLRPKPDARSVIEP